MATTTTKQIMICVHMFDKTPNDIAHDGRTMDVNISRTRSDASSNDVHISFGDSIRELSVWRDDPRGRVSDIKGAFLKQGCDRMQKTSWIMLKEWPSTPDCGMNTDDADFPYMKMKDEHGATILECPTRIFHLVSVISNPELIAKAVIDLMRYPDFVSILGLSAQISDLISHISVIESPDLLKTIFSVSEKEDDIPSPEFDLRIFSLLWKKLQEIFSSSDMTTMMKLAVAYLSTPFTRVTMQTLHERGIRVPFDIIYATVFSCEMTRDEKALVSMDEIGNSIYFMIPYGFDKTLQWITEDCHGRFIQSMSNRSAELRSIFASRKKAIAYLDEHWSRDHLGKIKWYDVPEKDADSVMNSCFTSFSAWMDKNK